MPIRNYQIVYSLFLKAKIIRIIRTKKKFHLISINDHDLLHQTVQTICGFSQNYV